MDELVTEVGMRNAWGVVENVRVAWLLGVRSQAIRGILVLGVLLLGFAVLSGGFSLRQPIVVAVDIGISGIRLMSLLLALFWVQESFVRDIERRTIVVPLVMPVPRWTYVVGRYVGILFLVSTAVLIWGGGLYLISLFSDWGYASSSRPVFDNGYLLVLLGIAVDAGVIAAFALAVSSVAVTPLLPLVVGSMFAISARAIGPATAYLEYSVRADPQMREAILPVLNFIRWVLPDLARLDLREITLYGNWQGAEIILAGLFSAVGYGMVMIAVAVAAYSRRELR